MLVSRRKVIKPSELVGTFEQKDVLVYIERGFFSADQNFQQLQEGSLYLIPRGNSINFRHGKPPYTSLGSEGFTSKEERELYLQPISIDDKTESGDDIFTIFGFEVLIHGAIPFFSTLELPCVRIESNNQIVELIARLKREEEQENVGKKTMLNKLSSEVVIQLCRYLFENPNYTENIKNLNFLLDIRLITIIQFIQDNLHLDLSNKQIASLVFVSKDYIGQFFKSLTNTNLQDYIENRRLEKAHHLLRTTNDNIHDIALKVGFKDPAYFSRRFKIRFNLNAKEVRKSDFLVM